MHRSEYENMAAVEDSHWWFASRKVFLATQLSQVTTKDLTLVDVGCGTGGTTNYLTNYGKVIGIEPSKIALSLLKRKRFLIVAGKAEAIPLADSSADIVCFLDVLYHRNVKQDRRALDEAHRILKPGGILIVTDCAFEFLRSAHDRVVHARERYTRAKLVKIIEQSGLKTQKATYTYFLLFPIFALKRLLEKNTQREASDLEHLPRWLDRLLFVICRIEATFLPTVSFPWGSSILISAKKPKKAR